jgi:succinate-semialdehyde dehydrogenase/glutarate-semialdehyde dehydrogenase
MSLLRSINPATGEELGTFEETPPAELERLLGGAEEAFGAWRRRPVSERGQVLATAARLLDGKRDEYARAMALEMGKPVTQGAAEVEKCAWACRYYAGHGEAFVAPEPQEVEGASSQVRFEPLGPVLAIMPWNFPFWQVFRFAAPALVAGNVALLKHASNVSRCALEIEQLLRAAGSPEGVFTTLLLGADRVAPVIADARVRAVTLTGSDRTGTEVAAAAGRALKKTVLELGGSDPFIVLADADLAAAARTAADARLVNSGQSCIAAKRFIVVEEVATPFLDRFVKEMAARRVGDPLARETAVGPLARQDLRDALHRQVEESVRGGARLLLGGRVPPERGAFYPPTVLDAVTPGMPAFDDETFGPVAAVVRAAHEAHAIALANASPFGLGASLWTRDLARAERLAGEIEAGSVFVNGQVKSDPRLPFGGIKRSGYGRELSALGLREFVNVKTVWVAHAPAGQAGAVE